MERGDIAERGRSRRAAWLPAADGQWTPPAASIGITLADHVAADAVEPSARGSSTDAGVVRHDPHAVADRKR